MTSNARKKLIIIISIKSHAYNWFYATNLHKIGLNTRGKGPGLTLRPPGC